MGSPDVNLAFIYSSIPGLKGGAPYFNEGEYLQQLLGVSSGLCGRKRATHPDIPALGAGKLVTSVYRKYFAVSSS